MRLSTGRSSTTPPLTSWLIPSVRLLGCGMCGRCRAALCAAILCAVSVLRCAAPAGNFSGCVSPWGLYDMAGNVEEWVSTATTAGHGIFKGGYFMHVTVNGLGCHMTTTAHAQWYHDYSLSFRCCADPVSEADAGTRDGANEPPLADHGVSAVPDTVLPQEAAVFDAPATVSCPVGMTTVPSSLASNGYICMDLYEAPNRLGADPLVMYDLYEAQAWCGARDKRLCYIDEWTTACEGPNCVVILAHMECPLTGCFACSQALATCSTPMETRVCPACAMTTTGGGCTTKLFSTTGAPTYRRQIWRASAS